MKPETIPPEMLRRALRELPATRADERFTERILEGLPRRPDRGRRPGLTAGGSWLLAAAVAGLGAVAMLLMLDRSAPSAPAGEDSQPQVATARPSLPPALEPVRAAAPEPAAPTPPPVLATTPAAPAPDAEALAAAAARNGDPRLAHLLEERRSLRAELAALQRQAAAPRPVLYLGGNESVDLVVDLAEVARRRPSVGAQPAVHRPPS
jgi:hypothetical protein